MIEKTELIKSEDKNFIFHSGMNNIENLKISSNMTEDHLDKIITLVNVKTVEFAKDSKISEEAQVYINNLVKYRNQGISLEEKDKSKMIIDEFESKNKDIRNKRLSIDLQQKGIKDSEIKNIIDKFIKNENLKIDYDTREDLFYNVANFFLTGKIDAFKVIINDNKKINVAFESKKHSLLIFRKNSFSMRLNDENKFNYKL